MGEKSSKSRFNNNVSAYNSTNPASQRKSGKTRRLYTDKCCDCNVQLYCQSSASEHLLHVIALGLLVCVCGKLLVHTTMFLEGCPRGN